MIRRFFCALLAALLLSSGAFADALPGLVRLQVVARSDSRADQALKLQIRDACLDCARICVSGAPDAETAYMRLRQHIPDFQNVCEAKARQLGYTGNIQAEAGVFAFPDRIYGRVRVPAGEYPALRVTIGEGEGRNWWCVLYPDLCSLDESARSIGDVIAWLRRRLGGDADA